MPYERPITKPVPSLPGYCITEDGCLVDEYNRLILGYEAGGYRTFKVKRGLPKRKTILAHRAVWEAWVGPIPKGYWINHEDGNKLNNALSNLKCETPSYNHLHASRVLKRRYARGLEVHTALLNPDAVEAVHFLATSGWSQYKISRVVGVSQAAISHQLNKTPRESTTEI